MNRLFVACSVVVVLLLAGGARAQAQAFGASGQAAFTMTSQGDFPFSF